MGNLTAHFSKSEFRCECGCGKNYEVPAELLSKLENLYTLLDTFSGSIKSINVMSGFRCIKYGVKNGYCTEARPDVHCKNLAVDIKVIDRTGNIVKPEVVAMAAEVVGFTGIGIMTNAVHVDIRSSSNYYNSKWFGDERSGKIFDSFKELSVFDFNTLFNIFHNKTEKASGVIASFTINNKKYGIIEL